MFIPVLHADERDHESVRRCRLKTTIWRRWRRLRGNQGTKRLDKTRIGEHTNKEQAEAEVEEKGRILTPLTPTYAHAVLSCQWAISIEREGIASEPRTTESRRLKTTTSDTKWRRFRARE
jgi:hypothetical protein